MYEAGEAKSKRKGGGELILSGFGSPGTWNSGPVGFPLIRQAFTFHLGCRLPGFASGSSDTAALHRTAPDRRTKEGRFDTALWQPLAARGGVSRGRSAGRQERCPAFVRSSSVVAVRCGAKRPHRKGGIKPPHLGPADAYAPFVLPPGSRLKRLFPNCRRSGLEPGAGKSVSLFCWTPFPFPVRLSPNSTGTPCCSPAG